MRWIKRKLRDKLVYVRVRPDGKPATDNLQRVEIVYKPVANAKIYRASVRNLEATGDPDDERPRAFEPVASEIDKSTTAETAKTKSTAPIDPLSPETITIYTDGACTGNPGPMGIGAVTLTNGSRREISEFLGVGTNNIAELVAIQRSLEEIPAQERHRPILVHTDSSYSIGILEKGWKAKANVELVGAIRKLVKEFPKLGFVKVKGHAGIVENERCDQLAREAIENTRAS